MSQENVAVVSFTDQPLSATERTLEPPRAIDSNPHQTIQSMFESSEGQVTAGIWTCTPGKWHAFEGRDEFCYLVNGHVRMTDAAGTTKTYKTGDAFLIPNGFKGTWEVVETTTKYYVIRSYA